MDIASLVHLLLWLIILGAVFGLLFWLIGYVGLPEPVHKVAKVVLAVVLVLLLVNFLLGALGPMPVLRLRG